MREQRHCEIPGCTEVYRTAGFCNTHYSRYLYVQSRPQRPLCEVDGCGVRPQHGHTLCGEHRRRKAAADQRAADKELERQLKAEADYDDEMDKIAEEWANA